MKPAYYTPFLPVDSHKLYAACSFASGSLVLFSCGSYSDLHHLEWKVFLQANLVAVCDTNLVYLIIESNCRSGNMECKINHLIIIFLSFVKLPCS